MSLTVQQLLSDAKRLSSRLRDHDQSADHLISRAQEVLKEVDAMRQYQEDVENLNEVAHNRPRAQLVLGIQQENRHIRTLQQENKELRAALEEHQNALELIMSKYRQHVTRLVNIPQTDVNAFNNQKIELLAERTEKVCEMAAVMKEAIRVDDDSGNRQQETMARLVTENKGLRELLDISQKSSPKFKKNVSNVHKEVQTEQVNSVIEQVVSVTLPMPLQSKSSTSSNNNNDKKELILSEKIEPDNAVLDCVISEVSSGDSDETGSEDESVKFDTMKKKSKDLCVNKINTEKVENFETEKNALPVVESSDSKIDDLNSNSETSNVDCQKSNSVEECNELVKANTEGPINLTSTISTTQPSLSEESMESKKSIAVVGNIVDQLVCETLESSSVKEDVKNCRSPPDKSDDSTVTIPNEEQSASISNEEQSEKVIVLNENSPNKSNTKGKGKKNNEKGKQNSSKKGNKK